MQLKTEIIFISSLEGMARKLVILETRKSGFGGNWLELDVNPLALQRS